MRTLSVIFSSLLVACAMTTNGQLAEEPAVGTWRFSNDLESVCNCLMRALNTEHQIKTPVAHLSGKSILHTVITAENGRVNHIVHDRIYAGQSYMFVVRSTGPKTATASAHVASGQERTTPLGSGHISWLEPMRHAASSCSGVPI
jgi:hypothetical protein